MLKITYLILLDNTKEYSKGQVDNYLNKKPNCFQIINPVNIKVAKKRTYGDFLLFGGWDSSSGLFTGSLKATNTVISVVGNLGFTITLENNNYVFNKTTSGNVYITVIY